MYTPAYNASFTKPLLNQLIAILQRDQASALALVNPALGPITEFHKGPGARTALPWLVLAVDSTKFDEQALGTRRWRAPISLALDVGQFDQEMAQDHAQDYARMLDMVLTTATLADFTTVLPIAHETVPPIPPALTGVTTPNAAGSVLGVFVASHTYGSVTLPELQVPVLRATLEVLFDLEET
jgi:hypothetical protein